MLDNVNNQSRNEKKVKSIRLIPWCIALSRSFILLFFTFTLHHCCILKIWMDVAFVLVFTAKKLRGSMNYHTSPTRLLLLRWQLKPRRCDTSREKSNKSKKVRIIIYIAGLNRPHKNDRCSHNKLMPLNVFQYSSQIEPHAVNSNCVIRRSGRKIIFKHEEKQ